MTGSELRSLRERLNLTLEEAGKIVGHSRAHICRLETRAGGEMPIPDGLLAILLEGLLRVGYDRDSAVTSALRELNERRAQLAGVGAGAGMGGRD